MQQHLPTTTPLSFFRKPSERNAFEWFLYNMHQAGKCVWDVGTGLTSFPFIGLILPLTWLRKTNPQTSPILNECGEAALGLEWDLLWLFRMICSPLYIIGVVLSFPLALIFSQGMGFSEYVLDGGLQYWDAAESSYKLRRFSDDTNYLPGKERTEPPTDGYRGAFSKVSHSVAPWCMWGYVLTMALLALIGLGAVIPFGWGLCVGVFGGALLFGIIVHGIKTMVSSKEEDEEDKRDLRASKSDDLEEWSESKSTMRFLPDAEFESEAPSAFPAPGKKISRLR